MIFFFMHMFGVAPVVPPYHPLLHQQEYLFMMKSRWMFPGDNILKLNTDGSSIGSPVLDTRHPWKSVMDAINMIMREQKCAMVHTRRDGNYCADLLAKLGSAKLGSAQFDEYIMLEEPPILLKPYLLQDTEAASDFQRKNRFSPENINNRQC
ncbi:hypothetical protein Tco_0907836 [Tanacetum coccineum]|uniref:RNase H type-1 domain-containing protein n=1 Tax=Tanacetum coccineum TaxID=301880 RepID=A0ABQ5CKG7_9ASTR